jgi:hypothetical protein
MLLLNYKTPEFLTKISLKPQELRWKPKKKNLDKPPTSLTLKELKLSKRLGTLILLMPRKLVRLKITYELMLPKKLVM